MGGGRVRGKHPLRGVGVEVKHPSSRGLAPGCTGKHWQGIVYDTADPSLGFPLQVKCVPPVPPSLQVKSGGLAARVATEGVMLQYAVDTHMDELLATLWMQVGGRGGAGGLRGAELQGQARGGTVCSKQCSPLPSLLNSRSIFLHTDSHLHASDTATPTLLHTLCLAGDTAVHAGQPLPTLVHILCLAGHTAAHAGQPVPQADEPYPVRGEGEEEERRVRVDKPGEERRAKHECLRSRCGGSNLTINLIPVDRCKDARTTIIST